MSLNLKWKHMKAMARVGAFSLRNSRKYDTDSILYPYVNTMTLVNLFLQGHRSMESFEVIRKLFASSDGESLIFNNIRIPIPDSEHEILHGLLIEIGDIIIPWLFQDNDQIVHGTTVEGPYEIRGKTELRRGDVVIDAGANMGLFSAVASAKGCNVYAFEPVKPVIEKYLVRTAGWNTPVGNNFSGGGIQIINKALSDKTGTTDFQYSEKEIASGVMKQIQKNSRKCVRTITVETITLDKFASENRLSRIDFIKADIEGAERNLLWGATEVMREFQPKIAVRTYHLSDDSRILRSIIKKANPGYTIFERYKTLYAYIEK